VLMFDPVLRSKLEIKKYTQGFERKKPVELVRWLEKAPNKPYSSRFLVVTSDGMIAFYHKDKEIPSTQSYDMDKDLLRISSSAGG